MGGVKSTKRLFKNFISKFNYHSCKMFVFSIHLLVKVGVYFLFVAFIFRHCVSPY